MAKHDMRRVAHGDASPAGVSHTIAHPQILTVPPPVTAARLPATSIYTPLGAALKRTFDVVVSVCLIAVMLPLLLIVALAIKLDSRGPVFYRVRRVGHHGQPLMMLKFRKMRHDAQGGPLTADEDPRLTRVGAILTRARLDELPQLWDVLRGRMSIVGPRPEDPEFVALHPLDYARILAVRPGITGLGQLAYAAERHIISEVDPVQDYISRILPQKLCLDTLYSGRANIGLDFAILRWTIATVIFRKPVAVDRTSGKMNVRRRRTARPAIVAISDKPAQVATVNQPAPSQPLSEQQSAPAQESAA